MKILHAIDSTAPSSGGPIAVIRQSQPFLERMDHRAEIVCVDAPDAPWLAALGIQTYALGPGRTWYRFATRLVPWLRLHAVDYDCVIVHGVWRYISCAVWRALKKSETPYFLYAHGMLDPALQDIFRWKQWQKRICWALVERKVARDARAVLFTRREEAQKAAESFRPYQVTSAVVPCCVIPPPEDRAEAREAFFECWPKARGKRVLLYLGRLNPVKGCDLLIEAFSRMADRDARLHLVMVGPSDPPNWIDQLKLRVRALGIEPRVTWPGMLSGDMKWAAFRIAEAFVLPSYHENFGIAIAEALACGTPVLISNHVHIWREIFEEEAGLVSEAGLDGTVSLLDRWLSLSASDRGAMRRNALRCFQKRFEGDAAATQLIEVLTAGINGRDLNHQEIAK